MSYDSNIPLVSDYILISQPQINANFQAINTVFSQNHIGLTSNEKSGMHNTLLFRVQPDPVTSSTQIALYTKITGGFPSLFYSPSSSATPIQLTYPSLSTGNNGATPPVWFVRQNSFVAGPFVVYAGILPAIASGTTVTLLPSTTLIYVGLTFVNQRFIGNVNYANVCPSNIVSNTFKVQYQPILSTLPDIAYFAIGQ